MKKFTKNIFKKKLIFLIKEKKSYRLSKIKDYNTILKENQFFM